MKKQLFHRSVASREALVPWGFLAPSLLLFGAITVLPLVYSVILSLFSGSFLNQHWTGLHNYAALANDKVFYGALRFGAIFTIATAVGAYSIGLLFALAARRMPPTALVVLRVCLILPWVIPPSVSANVWRWMIIDERSLTNQVITAFGFHPIPFFTHPNWAGLILILYRIWRSFPFLFLLLYAALAQVPREQYEAASLDRAGPWASFRHVTVPHLLKISILGGLLTVVWSFNDFESIFLLTGGGPSGSTYNVVIMIYYQAFYGNNIGLASAAGVVGLLLLSALVIVMLRLMRKADA